MKESYKQSTSFQEYEIDALQIDQMKKIAYMKIPKDQYERQIQKCCDLFKDIRAKQKFINELKMYMKLKTIEQEQLNAWKFDFNQFKNLMIDKCMLMERIFIKNDRNQANMQKFLRIQVSLKYIEQSLNFAFCIYPFQQSLPSLIQVKDQLVCESLNKQIQSLQQQIRQNQTNWTYIQKKKIKLLQLISQRQQQIDNINKNISKMTNQANILQKENCQSRRNSSNFERQCQIKHLMQSDNGQSMPMNQNQIESSLLLAARAKLYELKQGNIKQKQVYTKLMQNKQAQKFSLQKLLRKRAVMPRHTFNEFTELQSQLNELKLGCQTINQAKKKLGKLGEDQIIM